MTPATYCRPSRLAGHLHFLGDFLVPILYWTTSEPRPTGKRPPPGMLATKMKQRRRQVCHERLVRYE